jgi:hypothetical protein
MEELKEEFIFHIYAQDPNVSLGLIESILSRGSKILYEYITKARILE